MAAFAAASTPGAAPAAAMTVVLAALWLAVLVNHLGKKGKSFFIVCLIGAVVLLAAFCLFFV